MAWQTTSIVGDGAKGHHRFTLYVTDEWYDIASNKTYVTWRLVLSPISNGWDWYYNHQIPVTYIVNVAGTRYDGNIMNYNGRSTVEIRSENLLVTHEADGSKTIDFNFSVWSMNISYLPGTASSEGTMTLTPIPRKATITSAPNFTDEDEPVITFSNPAGDAVDYLEVGIYDAAGAYGYAEYRQVEDPTDEEYRFVLKAEEKERIYEATKNSKEPLQVQFYIKTTIGKYVESYAVPRTVTIVDADPVIDSSTVLALGRGNTVIAGCNYIELSFAAHGEKGASIDRKSVTCGNKSVEIYDDNYGALENVESGDFIFTVTDSRGNSTSVTVNKDFIPYVKPTCNMNVDMDIVTGTTAQAKLTISGTAYGGVISNETANPNKISVSYRWKTSTADYCEWIPLTDEETFYSYSFDVTIPDLNDKTTYTFQARVFDNVYVESTPVETDEYTARAMPIFDWGEDDFKFNVPVMISGNQVMVHDPTSRIARAFTQETEIEYDANSYIKLYRDGSPTDLYNQEIATFNENGTITIKKDMVALINVHICANTIGSRSWIRLMNYNSNWQYTSVIDYGDFTTPQISIVLPLTKDDVIGLVTVQRIIINSSGLTGSYIEIIEL